MTRNMMDKEFVVPVAEGHTMTLDAVVMPPRNNPSRVRLSLGTQYTCGNACAGGGSVTGSPTLRTEEQRNREKREEQRSRKISTGDCVTCRYLYVGRVLLTIVAVLHKRRRRVLGHNDDGHPRLAFLGTDAVHQAMHAVVQHHIVAQDHQHMVAQPGLHRVVQFVPDVLLVLAALRRGINAGGTVFAHNAPHWSPRVKRVFPNAPRVVWVASHQQR
jgi:hypothetical protein